MWEALRLAIDRAAGQPPIAVRYAHSFPEWGHNAANELTKTVFKGIVRMAPKANQSNETSAGKAGQLVGFLIRAAIFYWKEIPVMIERDGLNKLTKEGSVIKVLQKGMGHGSHWGVIANPVKRKARA